MDTHSDYVLFGDRWVPATSSLAELSPIDEDAEHAKRRRITATCPQCGQEFTQKRSLYRHQRTSNRCKPNNAFQESHACELCGKVFTRSDVLQRHEREHHESNSWTATDRSTHTPITESDDSVVLDTATSYQDGHCEQSASNQRRLVVVNDTDDIMPPAPPPYLPNGDRAEGEADLEMFNGLDDISPPTELADSLSPLSSTLSPKPLATFRVRTRSSLERLGASTGFRSTNNTPPCPSCGKPFETERTSLLSHIQSHVHDWQQEFVCDQCEITFQNQRNLEYHLMSARRGTCGFIGFEHDCSGHHPPTPADGIELTAHEHLVFNSFLQNFEQSQLDALIVGIDDLAIAEPNAEEQRWSWWRERPLPSTRGSSSIMPPSFRSEPKYVNGKPRSTIRRIEQKLASLSTVGPSALIRRRAAENATIAEQNRLDDSLNHAIDEGDVDRVQSILYEGADPNPRPSRSRSFQMSFLTQTDRYPGRRSLHVHSQKLAPLGLATVLGRLEIANVLMEAGAEHESGTIPYLDIINLTGLFMVFEPAGLAPAVLKSHAIDSEKARLRRGELNRLDTKTRKSLFDYVASPASDVSPSDLAEHLISANFSLGLQAMLDVGVDPNQLLVAWTTPLLEYALSQKSKECVVVLVAYGAVCHLEVIPGVVSIFLDLIDRLESQGFRKEAKQMLDALVSRFPESHRASACSYLLAQSIEFYATKTTKLINHSYNEASTSAWPGPVADHQEAQSRFDTLREHEQVGRPLSFAASRGRLKVVKMFLETVAASTDTNRTLANALCNAVIAGHVEVVELLLDAGANPTYAAHGGEPPLLVATRCNQTRVADLLIRRGADVHQHVPSHGTPLICAARGDHYGILKDLLRAGADIDFISSRFGPALCAALSRSPDACDYFSMVNFLLSKGADPSITGPLGSAIDVAVSMRKRCRGIQAAEVDMTIALIKNALRRSWKASALGQDSLRQARS